jgi:hypothetical protein
LARRKLASSELTAIVGGSSSGSAAAAQARVINENTFCINLFCFLTLSSTQVLHSSFTLHLAQSSHHLALYHDLIYYT